MWKVEGYLVVYAPWVIRGRSCLVSPKVIDTLNLPRFGKVVVRSALGDPVCAPLVNLQPRMPGANEYTGVTCVVCEGLYLDLILVADIVTKLNLARYELDPVVDR